MAYNNRIERYPSAPNMFTNSDFFPQQAAESLSMNGRALNDRAIEVSPSSSRVLDRAAGSQPPGGPPLLTPFPPSKNRPRPGDWTCPSCGFSNSVSYTHLTLPTKRIV